MTVTYTIMFRKTSFLGTIVQPKAVYLSVVQLTVNVDLTLCDVTRQIRDGMSNVCTQMTWSSDQRHHRDEQCLHIND